MFRLLGDIFRKLWVPFYNSSFVYGVVPCLANKRHDLANFACAQATMAVDRTRKKDAASASSSNAGEPDNPVSVSSVDGTLVFTF
ncbi:unnamed protein product [Lampetra fluviatilis]